MAESLSKKGKDKLYLVISYLNLRRAIGVLGVLFPVILCLGAYWAGGYTIQSSISAYYHTNMRDIFVGILFVEAVFLFSYRGHGLIDNIIGNLGCIFALGTAILPTAPENPFMNVNPLISTLHFVCATLFFGTLISFSLFLFTRTHKNKTPTRRKKARNRVYRACGFIMLVCILLIGLYHGLKLNHTDLANLHPVFWFESLALWAFGISWFTKGETIFRDVQNKDQ
jgi:hypothetical protein